MPQNIPIMPQYPRLIALPLLKYHKGEITSVAWSPDGKTLAVGSIDGACSFWNALTGERKFSKRPPNSNALGVVDMAWSPEGERLAVAANGVGVVIWEIRDESATEVVRLEDSRGTESVLSLAFSPDGSMIATGGTNRTGWNASYIKLWDASQGTRLKVIPDHEDSVNRVAWSPNGKVLASGSRDKTIRLWDVAQGSECVNILKGHSDSVEGLVWVNGYEILSGSRDGTVRLWNAKEGTTGRVLEGFDPGISNIALSVDKAMLAVQCLKNLWLWRCDSWLPLGRLPNEAVHRYALAFNPKSFLLASCAQKDRNHVQLWRVDKDQLFGDQGLSKSVEYTNAKVALVGDSGVGKSGLALVLTGQDFKATLSTHGRYVWELENELVEIGPSQSQLRETLLWDLAGQPGYRVYNQLHLNEVAVALVVFDARDETDPFAGIAYWARALDEATSGFPLVKLLISARADRGTPFVSDEQINRFCERYGFISYYQTSAFRGDGIEALREVIKEVIAWEKIPPVSAPELFHDVKRFLTNQKKADCILQTRDDLLRLYQQTASGEVDDAVIATCIDRLETSGMVRPLMFGNWTLLQPELLDNYCAWIAQAARAQKDGLGYIPERDALGGRILMDADRPLAHKPSEESILLVAVVEEIVARRIAWRQDAATGTMLVFPSELRADIPDYPGSYTQVMIYQFEGPVRAIYATLAVCLLNSITFQKKSLYKNAATFFGPGSQVCGFMMDYPDASNESLGRLTVFFDADVTKDVKYLFLRFVNRQLEKLALIDSVQAERLYQCGNTNCNRPLIPRSAVTMAKSALRTRVFCSVCGDPIVLDDLKEEITHVNAQVKEIEMESQMNEEQQQRLVVLPEKERLGEYDIFLCHNSKDKPEVREMARQLRDQGVLPWVDEEGILAGDQFIAAIENMVDEVPVVAVIVGSNWLGKWQQQEYYAFFQRFVEHRKEIGKQRLVIIPVLLPSAPNEPKLPPFLRGINYVDFRQGGFDNREAMRRMVKRIVAKHYSDVTR